MWHYNPDAGGVPLSIVPPPLPASPGTGFVTDGAAFPSSGGVNPGLTVPAPATRIASALPATRRPGAAPEGRASRSPIPGPPASSRRCSPRVPKPGS